jgi:hypothetical protein
MRYKSNSVPAAAVGVGLGIAVAALVAGCAPRPVLPPPSPDQLQSHVCYLASDDLEGRFPGTPGIDKAAAYIADRMKQAGLRPLFGGSYYQDFTIDLGLTIEGQPVFRVADAPLDYSVLPLSGSGTVWAAAAIVRDIEGVNEADSGADLGGKVAFVMEEPAVERDRWTMVGRDGLLEWMRRWADAAADRGAGAVVFVSGSSGAPASNGAEREPTGTAYAEERGEIPSETPAERTAEQAEGRAEDKARPTQGFHVFPVPPKYAPARIPCLEVTYAGLQKAAASQGILFEDFHRRLERDSAAASVAVTGLTCELGITTRARQVPVRNVGGVVPGRRLRDQYLVVGAHYDHLGRGEVASASPWSRDVHNGADDNSSGVAALIEVARTVAAGPTPLRSAAFVAFTAEEEGALGSEHFAGERPFSRVSPTAMINLDTVGRLEGNKLIVFGAKSAVELPDLIQSANRRSGFELVAKQEILGFSDQNPFYKRHIPALHIFTGANRDYHTPEDDCAHLNYPGLARIVEFASDLALEIANAPERLTTVVVAEELREEGQTTQAAGAGPAARGRGGYLGLVPDFSYSGEGVRITGTSPRSPAEAAGLQAGDIVVAIDGERLGDLKQLMTVLVGKSPGDLVTMEVLRDGTSVTRQATIGVRSPD